MESPKLHFVRYRKPGGVFFDPNTDIRKVVPMVVGAVLDGLLDEAAERDLPDVEHLAACVRVFELRLIEDRTPVDKQLGEFLDALSELPAPSLQRFWRRAAMAMMMVFALFSRRDAATDKQVLQSYMDVIRQSALQERLSSDTYKAVKEELKTRLPLLLDMPPDRQVGAVDVVSGTELPGIKEIARQCVQAGQDTPWDVLAELCDKEFSEGSRPAAELISLALAYPSYRNPTLEVTADGLESEAGPAEGPGEPGAIPVDGGPAPGGG